MKHGTQRGRVVPFEEVVSQTLYIYIYHSGGVEKRDDAICKEKILHKLISGEKEKFKKKKD